MKVFTFTIRNELCKNQNVRTWIVEIPESNFGRVFKQRRFFHQNVLEKQPSSFELSSSVYLSRFEKIWRRLEEFWSRKVLKQFDQAQVIG